MARRDNSGDDSSGNSQQILHRLFMSRPTPPPSEEATVEEGFYLFNDFMHDELERESLEPPQPPIEIPLPYTHLTFASPYGDHPSSVYTYRGEDGTDCPTFSQNSNTSAVSGTPQNLQNLGREIRQLADAFAESEQGRQVKQRAEEVDLEDLNCESLQNLLSGVFHDGKFSKTTIIAVFVFCSTLVIKAIRAAAVKISRNIVNWCFQYIKDGVCTVVRQEGGWEAVLHGMVLNVFKLGASLVLVSAAFSLLVFLWKK